VTGRPMTSDSGYADLLRQLMTTRLVEAGHIRTDAVERAFRNVPRHLFAPDIAIADAYRDRRIARMQGSCLTPPSLVAQLLEQLEVRRGQRVLEIGAGVGYHAALLADLVGPTGEVVTVEISPQLADAARRHLAGIGADNVHVVCGDGEFGWAERAPYDRIVLTCASDRVSPHWRRQLAGDGRLQLPIVLSGNVQRSVAFVPAGGRTLRSASVVDCFFVPQRGANDVWSRSWIILDPGRGLSAASDDRALDPAQLRACLGAPWSDLATGVAARAAEIGSGLYAWLATRDERCITLLQFAAAHGPTAFDDLAGGGEPGAATIGLFAGGRLAVLAPARGGARERPGAEDSIELVCRSYGDAGDLAHGLRDLVRSWAAAGRPSGDRLAIGVAPHGDELGAAGQGRIVQRGSCILRFDWAPAPSRTFA
jgi:protein-L-isoaspartate(D-aspartate) O-methyltransferase